MGKMYESLKGVVHETLQRSKRNPIPLAAVKHDYVSSLTKEIDDIERFIAQEMGRLKATVKHTEEVVNDETQAIEGLKENIATLKSNLEETENTLRKKDSAVQNIEDSLNGKIYNLLNELKNKEGALETRNDEINTLKSELDSYTRQVVELNLAIERYEHLTESSEAKIAALQVQLTETEEINREKDSTVKRLEQELTAKIQNLESQVTNEEKLLEARDVEINHLKSQLHFLTHGIKDTSSFFRQAEALATVETEENMVPANDQLNNHGQELPTSLIDPKFTSSSATPVEETVLPEFFDRATERLTLIIGPLAPVIVREHVVALGECMENFPKSRLLQLVEMLSSEIANDDLRFGFRKWFAQQFLQNLDATGVRLQSDAENRVE